MVQGMVLFPCMFCGVYSCCGMKRSECDSWRPNSGTVPARSADTSPDDTVHLLQQQVAQLQAELAQQVASGGGSTQAEERPKVRQRVTGGGRTIPPMHGLVPGELAEWMGDRRSDLLEALAECDSSPLGAKNKECCRWRIRFHTPLSGTVGRNSLSSVVQDSFYGTPVQCHNHEPSRRLETSMWHPLSLRVPERSGTITQDIGVLMQVLSTPSNLI